MESGETVVLHWSNNNISLDCNMTRKFNALHTVESRYLDISKPR